jgi:hypothetical protein
MTDFSVQGRKVELERDICVGAVIGRQQRVPMVVRQGCRLQNESAVRRYMGICT